MKFTKSLYFYHIKPLTGDNGKDLSKLVQWKENSAHRFQSSKTHLESDCLPSVTASLFPCTSLIKLPTVEILKWASLADPANICHALRCIFYSKFTMDFTSQNPQHTLKSAQIIYAVNRVFYFSFTCIVLYFVGDF